MTEYRKPKKNHDPIDHTCPTPIEALISCMESSHRRIPKMFPADRREAAIFWINHQEKRDDYSEAAKKEGVVWVTPYHDRLCRTLRIFLSLNDLHQAYVIEYAKIVPWRGDTIDFYQLAVKEEVLRLKDPKGYVEATLRSMKAFKFKPLPAAPADPDEQAKRPL